MGDGDTAFLTIGLDIDKPGMNFPNINSILHFIMLLLN